MSLRGRHLEGAVFDSADLRKADLEGARLQGASLDIAQLWGASLEGAQLQGASLDFAQLQGASLENAQLQGVSFLAAQLQGASFNFAQLQGAKLSVASLHGARLDFAQLQGATLASAQLQGASLHNAQLQGADFDNSELVGTDMSGAAVWRINFAPSQSFAVLEDILNEDAISKDEFSGLKAGIKKEVPEGSQREDALKRIEKLNPEIFGPEASQTQTLENVRAAYEEAFQKDLADVLKSLACSGDDASAPYVVQGLIGNRRIDDTGPFEPGLIESILAPDCPVSGTLTGADKADLRKLAKEAKPSESKP